MPSQCLGLWASSISGRRESDIDVQHEDATSGRITGKHVDSDQDIEGVCLSGAHINFKRTDSDGCTYHYVGELREVDLPPLPRLAAWGKVIKTCPPSVDKEGILASNEDWVAEKQT